MYHSFHRLKYIYWDFFFNKHCGLLSKIKRERLLIEHLHNFFFCACEKNNKTVSDIGRMVKTEQGLKEN